MYHRAPERSLKSGVIRQRPAPAERGHRGGPARASPRYNAVRGWPKPMSSISTITAVGAPAGALTSKRDGALALHASSSVIGGVSAQERASASGCAASSAQAEAIRRMSASFGIHRPIDPEQEDAARPLTVSCGWGWRCSPPG